MGEEYGETRPFPFFCSFSNPELVAAVRRGRKAELASVQFEWQHEPPDPQGERTFEDARLSWNWTGDPQRTGLRALYKDLLWARQAWFGETPSHITRAEILNASGDAHCLWFERGSVRPVQISRIFPQARSTFPYIPGPTRNCYSRRQMRPTPASASLKAADFFCLMNASSGGRPTCSEHRRSAAPEFHREWRRCCPTNS